MKRIDAMIPALPFSAWFDGKELRQILRDWPTQTTTAACDGGTRETKTWTDPASGLRVAMHTLRFDAFAAVDWFVEFTNTGSSDLPILEGIQALDSSTVIANQSVLLHHANGSLCQIDDFLPFTTDLGQWYWRVFVPSGGRSSNGVLPFMNVQFPDGGVVVGIGWSGQWAARYHRHDTLLNIAIGQQTTRMRLRPGETIRTPRILLLEWEGREPMDGQNTLRQLLLAHYLPRVNGQVPTPPIAHCLQVHYYATDEAGEHLERKAIPKIQSIGADTYWLDACWYGRSGRIWWQEVGSWCIHPDRFPNGLKPLADTAHGLGMPFVLWFEPERVRKDSIISQEHPEFLLTRPPASGVDPDNLLYDLGNPAAWTFMLDLLDGHISQVGVDVFRQDFNFDPLPYWETADAPDRVGMAENLHVQGLYRLWDELRRRHPNLWIDNCASGGRRIDLEMLMRSLPLWPTDYHDTVGLGFGMDLHVGDQCENAGLSRWVPVFGGGVWNFHPYSMRGQAVGGFTFGMHLEFDKYRKPGTPTLYSFAELVVNRKELLDDDFPVELVRAAIAEHRSLQPFITGDFWPLLPLTVAPHDWCAYQFHRHDLRAGFALFFRRHASPFATMAGVSPRWIDPNARYAVSQQGETYTPAPEQTMTGKQLQELQVTIVEKPGSMLLRYRQL